jgi:hypothetical protein
VTYLDELMKADEREERLPRWVRDRMESLRRAVRNAALDVMAADQRAEEARLATRPEESEAVLNPYTDVPIGLGKDPRVRFRPNAPDGGHIDVWIEHDVVRVMGPWQINVQPQSGNVIRVIGGQ